MKNKKHILEELEAEVSNDIGTKITKLVGAILAGGIATVLFFWIGGKSVLIAKELEAIFKLLSGASLAIGAKETAKNIIGIKYDKLSLKHLDKVEQEGIKKNKRLDDKRVNKINELSDAVKKQEKKVIIERVIGYLSATGCVVAGIASIFIEPLIWASVASLGLLSGLAVKETFDQKDLAEYKVRLENLDNDLYLGDFYGYDPDSKKREVKQEEKPNTKGKTNEDLYRITSEKDKPKMMTKKYEKK